MAFQDQLGPTLNRLGENYFNMAVEDANFRRNQAARKEEIKQQEFFQSREAQKERDWRTTEADKAPERAAAAAEAEARVKLKLAPEIAESELRQQAATTTGDLSFLSPNTVPADQIVERLRKIKGDNIAAETVAKANAEITAKAETLDKAKNVDAVSAYESRTTLYNAAQQQKAAADQALAKLGNSSNAKAIFDAYNEMVAATVNQVLPPGPQRDEYIQKHFPNLPPGKQPSAAQIFAADMLTFGQYQGHIAEMLKSRFQTPEVQAALQETMLARTQYQQTMRLALEAGVNPDAPAETQGWYQRAAAQAPELVKSVQPISLGSAGASYFGGGTPSAAGGAPSPAPAAGKLPVIAPAAGGKLPVLAPSSPSVAPVTGTPAPAAVPTPGLPAPVETPQSGMAPWWSIKGVGQRMAGAADPSAAANYVVNTAALPGRALDNFGRYGAAFFNGVWDGNYAVPQTGLVTAAGEQIGSMIAGNPYYRSPFTPAPPINPAEQQSLQDQINLAAASARARTLAPATPTYWTKPAGW